ncbi:unnamed protein product [Darwinula stevensoni]|uniref:Uncharacterized protein n=1 Tax=Darwinula stevensoni TaxID=69355 RepID=A0A7R8ZYJ1_9CRUS|nr:unnamed protein product [Darwinula stevensoni]CAG0881600.1 unnamed protein product [Darwinula stevensoni]
MKDDGKTSLTQNAVFRGARSLKQMQLMRLEPCCLQCRNAELRADSVVMEGPRDDKMEMQ